MMLKFICTRAEYELRSNKPNTHCIYPEQWHAKDRREVQQIHKVWFGDRKWLGTRRCWSKLWPEIITFFLALGISWPMEFCVTCDMPILPHEFSSLWNIAHNYCYHCFSASSIACHLIFSGRRVGRTSLSCLQLRCHVSSGLYGVFV